MKRRCSKAVQVVTVISTLSVVSACEVIKQVTQPAEKAPLAKPSLCLTEAQEDSFEAFCNISYWLEFVIETEELTSQQRIDMINDLGEETPSLVKKILLSQGAETPYQQRLRAQNWIVKISAGAPQKIKLLLNDLIYENSKQLLEFESAITILSRVNARQEKTISNMQLKLTAREKEIQKQQDQVEQLLKIETDLIEQNRNEKR